MASKSKKGFNYGKVAFYLLAGGIGLWGVSVVVDARSRAKRKKLIDEISKEEDLRAEKEMREELRKLGLSAPE